MRPTWTRSFEQSHGLPADPGDAISAIRPGMDEIAYARAATVLHQHVTRAHSDATQR